MTSQQPDEPAPPDGQPRLEAAASGSGTVFQAGRDQHLHFADGASAATRVRGETIADVCPYPGLAAFGPDQERWFFGRDRATAVLCQRLDAKLGGTGLANTGLANTGLTNTGLTNTGLADTGPLILIGPSGAGKSSLLHAGLIPALAQGRLPAAGSRSWPRPVLTPTAHPVRALARALSPVTGGEADGLAEAWRASPDEGMASVRRALAADGAPGPSGAAARAVIVVDQFEEVFTLCTDEPERRAFIDLLDRLAARPAGAAAAGSAAGAGPAALVLISVRADSYADCLRYRPLRAALQAGPVLLDPMTAAELRQAILFPAQDVGLEVEPGLVEVLLRDAGVAGDEEGNAAGYPAGRLPLLAHALRATWQEHEGHRLTVHGYQLTGGISNAVATSADRVSAGLDEASQQAARMLFLRLVKTGEGTADVCRRVSRAGLARDIPAGPGAAALDAFTHARLLTQDQDTVSITHEVLLRAWPRLRAWLDEDRAGNLIRQDLEAAATAWDRDQRAAETLYRGSRLVAARAWARGHDADLTGTGRDFLAASSRQQRRASRLRRGAAAALAVLTVVAVVTSVIALRLRTTAVQQRDQAIYNQTVAEALQLGGSNPALAAQLDLAAYRIRPGPASLARLVSTENTPLPGVARGSGSSPIRSVAASPAGHLVASGSFGGTIRLWDVADPAHPRLVSQFTMPTDGGIPFTVWSLAFSPDGRTLAAANLLNPVPVLWDVADPAHPRRIAVPAADNPFSVVEAVAFSPDGRTLASGGVDGAIRLWDMANPARPRLLRTVIAARGQDIQAVAFSRDDRTLATGEGNGTIQLWDTADPARPRVLGHPLAASTLLISALAFSPAVPVLASADSSGTIRLWNVADPAHPLALGQPLTGTSHITTGLAFSPDGSMLATCYGAAARLWDVADPASARVLGQPLTTSTDGTTALVFTEAGHLLVSGGENGSVQLWQLPRTTLTASASGVTSLAFRPDGRELASSDGDAGVQVWQTAQPGAPRAAGPRQAAGVSSVTYSPDGRLLAGGLPDGTVRLWTAADPAHAQVLGSPQRSVLRGAQVVKFSPDGRVLASGDLDGVIQLWGVADPAHPRQLGQATAAGAEPVESAAFSPDGQVLATGDLDGQIQLWDLADPAHPRQLGQAMAAGTEPVYSVAFSPDGRLLASADANGTVKLWNVASPARARVAGRPFTADDTAEAVAFNPKGKILAAGVADGTVLLWHLGETPSLPQPSQLIVADSAVTSVVFSPDGQTLASGAGDGGIRLWALNAGYAARQICRTTPGLTRQQWDRYVSRLLPYRPPC